MNYAEKCLSKGHAFFFPQGSKKRERRLFFASFVSFFPFVSLFQVRQSVKEAAPGEREPRENELLPSSYFPHHTHLCCVRKSHHRKDDEREDVIYILTYIHR